MIETKKMTFTTSTVNYMSNKSTQKIYLKAAIVQSFMLNLETQKADRQAKKKIKKSTLSHQFERKQTEE